MSDDTIKKNISKNISKYREAAGFSQKQLASKLGVVPSRISNWETGANCPTIDILFEVCEILNVSINDIYGIYPDSRFVLKFEEQNLIKTYRALDPHGKEMVDIVLQKEFERFNQNEAEKVIPIAALAEDSPYTVNAAHERTDVSPSAEDQKHDDDIMNGDF